MESPKESIPFNKPFIVGKELYYIAEAVLRGSIAGNATFTKRCETWLEEHLQTPRALLTHSCTAALEMAAILCGVGPGDEVIMPSFTFVSTANAFVLRGAVPVFVDIDPDTLNIDPALVRAAITPQTKAIVVVHYAGSHCDMDAIMAMANEFGLLVIEDAAQALLSSHGGKSLGCIGHIGCLSFHETKNVICGEGGALLVNDPRLIERSEIIREKGTNRSQFFRGQVDKYTWVDIGSSYLPSDIVAAFLFGQLEHADTILAKRRHIADRYRENLMPLEYQGYLKLPRKSTNGDGNGHLFYVLTRARAERTGLISFLRERGIHPVFHYVPLHSSPAGRKYGRTSGSLAVTDRISDTLLRLPLYFELSDSEVDTIATEVVRYFR